MKVCFIRPPGRVGVARRCFLFLTGLLLFDFVCSLPSCEGLFSDGVSVFFVIGFSSHLSFVALLIRVCYLLAGFSAFSDFLSMQRPHGPTVVCCTFFLMSMASCIWLSSQALMDAVAV